MENEIIYIKLDDIIPNRFQPREVFDEEALNKLADSIRQHGVIEPILVRPVSNKYEIVAGERRYKASILAGLTKIPAMVRPLSDKESSIIAFIENEHRSDVSAIEEARTMDRILKNNNMTQDELAKEIGVNQSTIANKLRLLNLPMEIQESVMRNEISERHARSLLSVKDEAKQKELLEKIKERKMTVRELENEIKSMNEEMNNNFNNPGYTSESNFGVASGFNPFPSEDDGTNAGGASKYLNDFNSNPTPEVPPMPDFLSGFNIPSEPSAPIAPEVPSTPVAPETQQETPSDTSFMSFLNDYDNKNPLPPEDETPSDDGASKYLNDFNSNPTPEVPPMPDFLKDFNIPSEPSAPIAPEVPSTSVAPQETQDTSFMSFLNDYDNRNPLPPEETTSNEVENSDNSSAVTETSAPELPSFDFLKDFNIPSEPSAPVTPSEPVVSEQPTSNNDLYSGFNAPSNDNLTINNVTPPVTSNFNTQYVEDNANYVDVSKQARINSVDEIIQKLGDTIKEIKEKSVFKVDTEEINYDDIYQVTIKIDKRDF